MVAATDAAPDEVKPDSSPRGDFVTLFNGKIPSNWHGVATMYLRRFEAMSTEGWVKALEKGED